MDATPPLLTVASRLLGDTVRLISVCGEVDVTTGPQLDSALALAWKPPSPCALLVDLGNITFFGSSGLRCLLNADHEARTHGATFGVCNPSRPALRALKAAALDGVFPLYTTTSAALAHHTP
ncbi:STAS domain-containing protein [Saccharothrix sp. AJ9571]|nr:STAS domain-containing protein [Saccharothrix sp. AJ9571]